MAKVIQAPRFGQILNERPEGMVFEEYKERRREQREALKKRLRGFVAWKSKGVFHTDERTGKITPVESWGTATADKIPVVKFVN